MKPSMQKLVAGVALVAILGLVAGSVGMALIDDTGADAPTTANAELSGAAKELAELLDRDLEARFHATYAASSASTPDAEIRVETWRDPPRRRQDTAVTSGDQRLDTRVLTGGDGEDDLRCGRVSNGPWECERVLEQDSGALLTADIRSQLQGADVTARDGTIDGRTVRCFTMERAGQQSEFCATPKGIPVRVRAGESELRLLTLDEGTVEESVFEPPAAPTS